MKQNIYYVKGMTCMGCVNSVKEKLAEIPEISTIEIDLNKKEVQIFSEKEIKFDDISQKLENTSYSIYRDWKSAATDTYYVRGMSCNGCVNTVKSHLETIDGIKTVEVNGRDNSVKIITIKPVSFFKLKKSLENTHYTLVKTKEELIDDSCEKNVIKEAKEQEYYCPMMCEGDKIYEQMGDCPVCGMDLVPKVKIEIEEEKYTCPTHSEILKDEPGNCPICGKDLIFLVAEETAEQKIYTKLLSKLKIAVLFTFPVFIIAMLGMWKNNVLFSIMDEKYWNYIQFILTLPVVFHATWIFFERAYRSVKSLKFNMFTLIGIGAGAAWIYSVIALFIPQVFPSELIGSGEAHLYFESTVVILTLVLVGQVMEARAHTHTNSAIKELIKLAPHDAIIVENGEERKISLKKVKKGDVLKVKPGGKIPVDGIIIEGESYVDESMITGEPIPIDKQKGDSVKAGTINGNQTFLIRAQKVGAETMLSQIISMVNEASRSRAPIQHLADKISGYFVPVVVGISILTFVLWWFLGPEPSLANGFVNAIAVLIIACPCALGLATPMSVMVGMGKGAQNGILIKNAQALEELNKINTLVIDKTGTITEGKPSLEKILKKEDYTEEYLMGLINGLNQNSEHPLAKSTLDFGKEKGYKSFYISQFKAISGKGVKGDYEGEQILLGNQALLKDFGIDISEQLKLEVLKEIDKGKTVSYLAYKNEAIAAIIISDLVKKTSKKAIEKLKSLGVEVIMLTGDNQQTAKAVAREVALDMFEAEMLPEDKMNRIRLLQQKGKKVAMAGDGINDAPALAQSDIGIAMGTGTDVAIESADIALVKGNLEGIAKALSLSKNVMKNIRQNLFFALIYNSIGVPIAAGLLFPIFGILLSPMIAALAMSFSSVSVISNALRLRNVKL